MEENDPIFNLGLFSILTIFTASYFYFKYDFLSESTMMDLAGIGVIIYILLVLYVVASPDEPPRKE